MNCKDLFDLYVLKEAEFPIREWMTRPNINPLDGKVWATDGHAAIIIPVSLAGHNYLSKEMKTPWPAISESQRVITIEQIEEAIAKCDKEEVIVEDMVECPECVGTGKVIWTYDTNLERYHKEDECPVCDGDGYIWKGKPSGRFEPSHKCAISIGAGLFIAWQIDRIAKTMRMIGADTLTVMSKPTEKGAVLFRTGDVEILLMPAITPDKVCTTSNSQL